MEVKIKTYQDTAGRFFSWAERTAGIWGWGETEGESLRDLNGILHEMQYEYDDEETAEYIGAVISELEHHEAITEWKSEIYTKDSRYIRIIKSETETELQAELWEDIRTQELRITQEEFNQEC